MDSLRRLCEPLYAFTYKYFDKLDLNNSDYFRYDFILSPAELFAIIKQADQDMSELLKRLSAEDDVVDWWAHKELLLKSLVVMTTLPMLSEPLQREGILLDAEQIRDRLINDFSQKIMEDPNVVHALQTGTIDQELADRRTQLFNFKPLFETRKSFVTNPYWVKFEEIPDEF